MHSIPKKVEPILFNEINSDVPLLILQPKEKNHIPFTYCTLSTQSSQLEVFKVVYFFQYKKLFYFSVFKYLTFISMVYKHVTFIKYFLKVLFTVYFLLKIKI